MDPVSVWVEPWIPSEVWVEGIENKNTGSQAALQSVKTTLAGKEKKREGSYKCSINKFIKPIQ